MSNVAIFSQANLPSVATLSTALRSLETSAGPSGVTILKMDKTGHWVFGADQTEVQAESTWAINPFSFVHGFIAWGDGEVLGEKMTGVSEPLPELDAAPPAAKQGWQKQLGFSLKCLSGDDAGLECRYSSTSTGGLRAIQTIGAALAEQVDKDQTKPVPVVILKKDHYQHKSYGKIYTPVFQVVEWMSLDGEPASGESGEDTQAPARRRRAV
jgi:hypothetical protein